MRGYFPSTIPGDDKYYSRTLGMDVIELIKSFGEEKAILVGHDWGATAAYAAALIQPEIIEKLIAASVVRGTYSKALLTNPEQQRKSWYIYFFQLAIAEMAIPTNDFAFIKRLWKDWSSKNWELPSEQIASVIETFKHEGVVKAAISYYRCFFDMSKLSKEDAELQKKSAMGKITVPTLYLHGTEDGCIGSELCEGMEAFFTGSFEKVMFQGVGHFIHLEKPDEFNDRILKFIQ
jgi:pimeloyl-ACP methyl ester carboxylesterase